MNYLLDTNILVIYSRANTTGRMLEADLNLFSEDNRLIVSVVSVGEIRSIALRNKWGKAKIQRLEHLLGQFLIAEINADEIIKKYAEIDAYSQDKLPSNPLGLSARNMGKNDLWIAATSAVLELVLVTTDSDFDHLDGSYVQIEKVKVEKYLK